MEKIRDLFKVVDEEFGWLDIFINNVVSGVFWLLMELEELYWDWIMNINVKVLLFVG